MRNLFLYSFLVIALSLTGAPIAQAESFRELLVDCLKNAKDADPESSIDDGGFLFETPHFTIKCDGYEGEELADYVFSEKIGPVVNVEFKGQKGKSVQFAAPQVTFSGGDDQSAANCSHWEGDLGIYCEFDIPTNSESAGLFFLDGFNKGELGIEHLPLSKKALGLLKE